MLPFLKKKQEASISGEDEPTLKRDHDETFDMLDAVAEDMLAALHSKDKGMLKSALQALCEHIQNMDTEQDKSLINEES